METTMTKENIKKLLEDRHHDLKRIFYDEARKVEKDDQIARHLAEEALDNLRHALERSTAS